MAEPVRVRRLSEQEGKTLQRIVRRGNTSTVRFRRAMMLLASAGGDSVPVIARLVQADQGTGSVRENGLWLNFCGVGKLGDGPSADVNRAVRLRRVWQCTDGDTCAPPNRQAKRSRSVRSCCRQSGESVWPA
jgi:hypothetical protein